MVHGLRLQVSMIFLSLTQDTGNLFFPWSPIFYSFCQQLRLDFLCEIYYFMEVANVCIWLLSKFHQEHPRSLDLAWRDETFDIWDLDLSFFFFPVKRTWQTVYGSFNAQYIFSGVCEHSFSHLIVTFILKVLFHFFHVFDGFFHISGVFALFLFYFMEEYLNHQK